MIAKMNQWFLIIESKLPLVNFRQRDRLSEFCANLAVADVAITILPAIVGIDTITAAGIILGLVLGTLLLWASLRLLKGKHADKR
jgi:hypothetical protein